jgi:hypothetical protein
VDDTTREQYAPLFAAMLNLTEFHREHEKFYSVAPREQAVALQRHSRTVHALADRWSTVPLGGEESLNPYAGARDLNDVAALQLDGVLFMEGEGEPGEITRLKRDVRLMADDASGAGEWLADAMESSWGVAAVLLEIDELADLLGERHRIIANNWQAAALMTLVSHILARAVDLLERIDFTPAALRADLSADRLVVARLRSTAEMFDHAADLLSEFAGLVHDNERRWRVFRTRVEEIVGSATAHPS